MRNRVLVAVRRADGVTETRGRGVAPDAVFEIGSITKAFTGTLLADMVREGLVAFEDPVARYVPEAPPDITLEHLATHTSGLPRLPKGLRLRDRKDPYAKLDLRAAIPLTRPKRPPGAKAVYSNYGMGLLGFALAQRAGTTYGELVRERIAAPLNLTHTALDTPGLVQGHTRFGRPTPPWNLTDLAGAGGLRSTAPDLLEFLALHWRDDTPLAEAAHEARRPRTKLGRMQIGLAWVILPDGTVAHDGGTGGFRTFAAANPDTRTAVVVLSNQARGVGRLGLNELKRTLRGLSP
jgi:CubicO group peptidase (beta-lactamase class C family)